jgi:hypothetical protein
VYTSECLRMHHCHQIHPRSRTGRAFESKSSIMAVVYRTGKKHKRNIRKRSTRSLLRESRVKRVLHLNSSPREVPSVGKRPWYRLSREGSESACEGDLLRGVAERHIINCEERDEEHHCIVKRVCASSHFSRQGQSGRLENS